MVHYKLLFLDDAGAVQTEQESDFDDDATALVWMRVIGAERSQNAGWAIMELRCNGRFVAGLPSWVMKRAWKRGLRLA